MTAALLRDRLVGWGKVTGPDDVRKCTEVHKICGGNRFHLRRLYGTLRVASLTHT